MAVLIINRINLRRLSYPDLLPELEGELLLICDREAFPEGEAGVEIGALYRHIELIDNFDVSGGVELAALRLFQDIPFTHILAVSEFDLLRAARLREKLGLPGQQAASALAYRDKILMKRLAAEAGLAVPVARPIHNVLEVLSFVETYGLPVVIKPTLGAGSVNTHIVRTEDALRRLLNQGLNSAADAMLPLEIETFVDGSLYYIDGFRHRGEVLASWPSRYLTTCHDFAQGQVLGGFTLSPLNPVAERLRQYTADLLSALPTPDSTAFHAELFHTTDDRIVLCEIASRIGGPRSPEMFAHALGFDLIDAFIRSQAGLEISFRGATPVPAPTRLCAELLLPARAGTLISAPATCDQPGVLNYSPGFELGHKYQASNDVGDFIASLLFSATSEDEMISHIRRAALWFEESTVWSTGFDAFEGNDGSSDDVAPKLKS